MRKVLLAVLAIGLAGGGARAADHLDGPQASADPAADITDLFGWMTADKTKVNLAMDLFPKAAAGAKFSTAVKYAFHLNTKPAFGGAATPLSIICTFDAAQKISCWLQKSGATIDYVNGDASATAGISSANGKLKVFAGLRDDPFFFNIDGFHHAAATVHALATGGTLTLDSAGCPTNLTAQQSATLVSQLKSNAAGTGPGVDNFKGLNVMAIVIQVDAQTVTSNGSNPIIGLWASTNK
jgi:hypothetical protein